MDDERCTGVVRRVYDSDDGFGSRVPHPALILISLSDGSMPQRGQEVTVTMTGGDGDGDSG